MFRNNLNCGESFTSHLFCCGRFNLWLLFEIFDVKLYIAYLLD